MHDEISTLLNNDDPIERGLALKHKSVEPFHLRQAMQDEDPTIRELAVKHPKMTPELLREILTGDDEHLKHMAIERPDLRTEELELVAHDPKLAEYAVHHRSMTPELREKLLQSPTVPEHVKGQHFGYLAKSIGYVTFPLLGESNVHSKVPVVNQTGGLRKLRLWDVKQDPGAGAVQSVQRKTQPTPAFRHRLSGYAIETRKPADPSSQRRLEQKAPGLNEIERAKAAIAINTGKATNATIDHESQHVVFARIGAKHGWETRKNVIKKLLSKLPPEHLKHIQYLFQHRPTTGKYSPVQAPEEMIAHMHNYLQDPTYRAATNHKANHTVEAGRESLAQARKAWEAMRHTGERLTPEEVGITQIKKSDTIQEWVADLNKTESEAADQLGFAVGLHSLVEAAKFLTNKKVSKEDLRFALLNCDGDLKEGVLNAYGLNTPEGRRAFDAVDELRTEKAEPDFLANPSTIEFVLGERDVADIIRDAYKAGRVEPVKLSGKHTTGTHIAEDRDGWHWLLKPGSSKQSPAAGAKDLDISQSVREVTFSMVANEWGIDEIAPSSLLRIDGKEVAVLHMWPLDYVNLDRAKTMDANLPRRAFEPYRESGKLWKWATIDYVLGNPDRHGNNIMVGPADQGNPIGLIDQGSALAGSGFNPGHDENSFIPYYLRCWAGPGFYRKSPKDKLAAMPIAPHEVDDSVREWAMALDPEKLKAILLSCGVEPSPFLDRLAKVQSAGDDVNFTSHINGLWAI